MTDVVSQLEAVLAGIALDTLHDTWCAARGHEYACNCSRDSRVRSEIARTVASLSYIALHVSLNVAPGKRPTAHEEREIYEAGWAAAFRATQEQETQP